MPVTELPAASAADTELAAQLGAAISRLLRVASRAKMEAATRSDRVELTTFPLLVALAEAGPMRANALAGAVFSDPSTVSRQVASLVTAGYVERRSDPEDGRASLLALTTSGRATLGAHRRLRDQHIARITAAWPTEDRRQLAVLVDRLATDFAHHLQSSAEPAADHPAQTLQELS